MASDPTGDQLRAAWRSAEGVGAFAMQQTGRWMLGAIDDRDALLGAIRDYLADAESDPESFPEGVAIVRRIDRMLGRA